MAQRCQVLPTMTRAAVQRGVSCFFCRYMPLRRQLAANIHRCVQAEYIHPSSWCWPMRERPQQAHREFMRNFRQSSDGNNTALHLHEPLSLPTSVLRATLVQELPTRCCTNLDSNMQIRADVDSSLQVVLIAVSPLILFIRNVSICSFGCHGCRNWRVFCNWWKFQIGAC